MSKKQKDPTGFVFDVQSNTVLAQGGSYENMKEKITAVRAVVPNKSNNEIILVLQHFDNSVDRAVQAFMEGSAIDVLKEWKVNSKKKNKKKKTKPSDVVDPASTLVDTRTQPLGEEEPSPEGGGINGYHVNGLATDTESVDSLSQGLDTLSIDARDMEDSDSVTLDGFDGTELGERKSDLDLKLQSLHLPLNPQAQRTGNHDHRKGRAQALAMGSQPLPEDVPLSSASRKLGANIEKSVKDLQRCSVSLVRYRMGVKEEMDASIKKMKQTFAELQSCLMDREVALLAEMDKVKAEAMDILKNRQKKAEDLKKLTDVAVRMSEEQLSELRADIKHFVSERKYDEDLGRSARFTCDVEPLKNSINCFGQVSHPKNSYSSRSRCSSLTSATSPSDTSAPSTPDCSSAPSLASTTRRMPPTGDGSGPSSHSGTRPFQPPRQVFQGNRRGGQGYRYQGQRPTSGPNQGRPDSTNRYKNNSWSQSTPRYQGYPARPPGPSNDRGQTHFAGANISPSDASQPSSSSAASLGPSSPDHKALPQRKPRPAPSDVASS